MRIMLFIRNLNVPASSLFLGDFISLVVNLLVFRSLLTNLPADRFADWEWISIWLGLCLLLPRNGLEIVAQRSSVRSRRLMEAWLTIVLSSRIMLSIPAMALFAIISLYVKSFEFSVVSPLALTMFFSSASPDLAARVQGRFRTAGMMIIMRNALFLSFLKLGLSYSSLTLSRISMMFLCAEFIVGIMWWMDAWFHQGLPGVKKLRLLLKCSNTIATRSLHQTFSRWLRVFSWSSDAILIGFLMPQFWVNIAPARRMLMTAVIPIANWLGSLGPLMGRIRVEKNLKLTRYALIVTSALSLSIALCAGLTGEFFLKNIAGMEVQNLDRYFVVNSLRIFPLVASMILSASLTSMRQDKVSVYPAIALVVSQGIGVFFATLTGNALLAQLLIASSEWLGILCLIVFLHRKYGVPVHIDMIESRIKQQSLFNRPYSKLFSRSQYGIVTADQFQKVLDK